MNIESADIPQAAPVFPSLILESLQISICYFHSYITFHINLLVNHILTYFFTVSTRSMKSDLFLPLFSLYWPNALQLNAMHRVNSSLFSQSCFDRILQKSHYNPNSHSEIFYPIHFSDFSCVIRIYSCYFPAEIGRAHV